MFEGVKGRPGTRPLRFVHRRVPAAQQSVCVFGVPRKEDDPDAGSNLERLALDHQWFLQGVQDPRRGRAGRRIVRHPRKDDGELVAAQPGDRIGFAKLPLESGRHVTQDLVTAVVPEGVVDLLEFVQVHHQQRQRLVFALADQDGLAQAVEHQGAVGEIRQAVVQRQVLERHFLLLAGRDVLGHHDQEERLVGRTPHQRGDRVAPDEPAEFVDVAQLLLQLLPRSLSQLRQLCQPAVANIVGMDEGGERVVGQLVGAVAKHSLQRRIRLDDLAPQVDPRDPDRGPIEDGAKPFLALAQGLLDLLALSDVQEARDHLERLAVRTHHRDGVDQDPAHPAIGEHDLVRNPLHGLPATKHDRSNPVGALQLRSIFGICVPELVRRLASHLLRAEPDDPLAGRIDLDDDAGGAEHQDAGGDAPVQRAKPLLRGGQVDVQPTGFERRRHLGREQRQQPQVVRIEPTDGMGEHGHRTHRPATRHQRDAHRRPHAVGQGPGNRALPPGIVVDDQRLFALKGEPGHALPRFERPRGARLVSAVVGEAMEQAGAGNPPVERRAVDPEQIARQVHRVLRQGSRLEHAAGRHRQFVQGSQGAGADRRTCVRLVADERSTA